MIKVAVLTTVWKRPLVTSFHFKWMAGFRQQCQELGIELVPLYVLSSQDGCIELFKRAASRHRHPYLVSDRSRLTDKSQAGLDHLKEQYEFSWLMHLDSDEIVSMELMKKWKEEFTRSLWFGSKACYFADISSKKVWEFYGYNDHPVKNGGTCLHRQVLEHVQWKLWPRQRDQGLNIMERRRIQEFGYQLKALDTQDCYGVVEIKGTGTAIHNLAWFHKRGFLNELNAESKKDLLEYHPRLKLFI